MRKLLTTITLSLTLLCTTFTIPTFASTSASPTINRYSGIDRYETASAIAKSGWVNGSENAILAFGGGYSDALSSTPLAKKYDAPILLTESASLTPITKQTIIDLKVKRIYIIGGTGVISGSIDTELQSMGITTQRIFGQTQYDTNIEIAKQITSTPSAIFVCTSDDFSDALSCSPIASMKQDPIILVPSDNMPDSVKNYISSNNSIKTSYVVGYSDIINDNIANQFPNLERILGSDRYSRNIAVNQKFNSDFSPNNMTIASGEQFPDALSGSALASKLTFPIILVNFNSPDGTKNYYQQRLANASNPSVTVFGGTAVVPDNIVQGLGSVSSPSVPSTPVDNTPTPPAPSNPIPVTPVETITPTSPSSFSNPYPLNVSQTINVKNFLSNYTAQVSIEQIIRGQEAWTMISKANMFNKAPKSGYEYILAKINLKLLDIDEGKALSLVGNVDFKLVSQSGRSYDDIVFGVAPDPSFDTKLYKGGSTEGWVIFLVKTDDTKPVLSYGTNYDGSGGIWFKAYGDSNVTPVNTIIPITANPITSTQMSDSDFQNYLNQNYGSITINDKTIHFTWDVNKYKTPSDVTIHGSVTITDFQNWLWTIINGHKSDLESFFTNLNNSIATNYPNKSYTGNVTYQDTFSFYPKGFPSDEMIFTGSSWLVTHRLVDFGDLRFNGISNKLVNIR